MKTETPFLDFYNECMKTGMMPHDGMCKSLSQYGLIQEFALENDFFGTNWYWAYDGVCRFSWEGDWYTREFTILRQTIVLFCAAINNEL